MKRSLTIALFAVLLMGSSSVFALTEESVVETFSAQFHHEEDGIQYFLILETEEITPVAGLEIDLGSRASYSTIYTVYGTMDEGGAMEYTGKDKDHGGPKALIITGGDT